MKRIITALACLALMLSLAACGADTHEPVEEKGQSYADIFKVINEVYDYEGGLRVFNGAFKSEMMVEDTAASESAPAADYSGTNVQVEGIDEGDIVKTDGEYIYALSGNELRIFKADGENTALVKSLKVCDEENCWVREMYLCGDKLVIVAGEYEICYDGVFRANVEYTPPKTKLLVYDVAEPENISYVNCMGQDGSFVSSRLYDESVYLVTRYNVGGKVSEENPETYIPSIICNDKAELLPADDICIMVDADCACYTVVTKFDISSGENDSVSLLGGCDTVYMSANNLYTAYSSYTEETSEPYTVDMYTVTDYSSKCETKLCRIDLASMTVAAEGSIPGNLESQFSMDEYNGCLRLVATDNAYSYSIYTDEKNGFENYKPIEDAKSSTGLYILDGSLNQLAAIDGLAETEYVRSVRFDGDFVYFCTFRQTDPLFAVNVADPNNPVILSEYKISGFSEYLHPWSDGLLFGLGMEADENTGATDGLKLVMFDVSDKADVKALHTMNIPDGWTEALYDHHALLISPEKGIIGFDSGNAYTIYGYDADSGFNKLASITRDENNWYSSRGMYIGDFAYIVTGNGVTVLDMQSFEVVATIDCPAAE